MRAGRAEPPREQRAKLRHKGAARPFGLRRNSLLLLVVLFVLVLLVAVVNLVIVYQQGLEATREQLEIHSQRLIDETEDDFQTALKITESHKWDSSFYTTYQKNFVDDFFYIKESLQKDGQWASFFDDLAYINCRTGYLINSRGEDSFHRYFSAVLESPTLSQEVLSAADPQAGVQAFRVYNKLQNAHGVLFFVPLETSGDTMVSCLSFTVYDSTLAAMWSSVSTHDSMVLYYNQQPVYASNSQLLQRLDKGEALPDTRPDGDLRATYKGNAFSVGWDISHAAFFQNILGTVALQAGLTFAVLAGILLLVMHYVHASYAPVRQLLQHVPARYRSQGALDEFKYIDMALTDLSYSQKFLEESNQEMRQEKYLYYILDDQVKPGSAIWQQCLDAGIHVDCRYFACILLDDTAENEGLYEQLCQQQHADNPEVHLYSIYIMEDKYLFLLCADCCRSQLLADLALIRDKNPDTVAVSDVVEGVAHVRAAYTSVCRNEQHQKARTAQIDYPELELETLQEAVTVENLDKVEFALRMIKKRLQECSEMWRASVFVMVCNILNQGNRKRTNEQVRAVRSTDVDTISTAMDALFSDYWRAITAQREREQKTQKAAPQHRSLHNLMRYIQQHYQDPDFSIKRMADDFGTSSSNLSHFFKKSTGQTLSRFIDEMTIQRAEELLRTDKKVSEVAQVLGFTSASSFIETFKRMRGVTPSAFRNAHRADESGKSE